MSILKATITEEITIRGVQRVVTNEMTITDVSEIDYRTVKIPTSEIEVINFNTANGAGQFKDGAVRYIRISHTGNNSGVVTLRVLGNGEEYFVKLESNESFLLGNSLMDANATGGQSVTLAAIDSIKAISSTADTILEYFVIV